MKVLIYVLASFFVSINSATAHHSFAGAYDLDKPIVLEGTVVDWRWISPHVQLLIETADEDGILTTWNIELGARRALTVHLGWTQDMIQAGDQIKVAGYLSRREEHSAAAGRITIASGEELRAVRQIQ